MSLKRIQIAFLCMAVLLVITAQAEAQVLAGNLYVQTPKGSFYVQQYTNPNPVYVYPPIYLYRPNWYVTPYYQGNYRGYNRPYRYPPYYRNPYRHKNNRTYRSW